MQDVGADGVISQRLLRRSEIRAASGRIQRQDRGFDLNAKRISDSMPRIRAVSSVG